VADLDSDEEEKRLQPVYGISLEDRLHEREMHRLTGYRGMGPVILGNRDAESIQHDVYGSVILALTQTFFDKRLDTEGTEILFHQLESLGEKAIQVYNKPDSGPSGLKLAPAVHTYSSASCWAACDRLAKIAAKLCKMDKKEYWCNHAATIRNTIMEQGWNKQLQTFTTTWGGDSVDSFLLLLPRIGFIEPTDEHFLSTLKTVEKTLKVDNYLAIYPGDKTASNSATFWFINALAGVGRMEEARKMFDNMINTLNHNGLLSETVDPATKELWGNFPQSTAMVGLIDCAIRLSKPWKGAF